MTTGTLPGSYQVLNSQSQYQQQQQQGYLPVIQQQQSNQMLDHVFANSNGFQAGPFGEPNPGFLQQQQQQHMIRRNIVAAPNNASSAIHPSQHPMERHSPLYAR